MINRGPCQLDEQMANLYRRCVYVVWPCTHFEKFTLWQQHSSKSEPQWGRHGAGHRWEDFGVGRLIEAGTLGDRHVIVTVYFATIEGQVVAFIEPGWVCDMSVVERWLDKEWAHVPKYDGPGEGVRLSRCDPMNFHNCLGAIEWRNERKVKT